MTYKALGRTVLLLLVVLSSIVFASEPVPAEVIAGWRRLEKERQVCSCSIRSEMPSGLGAEFAISCRDGKFLARSASNASLEKGTGTLPAVPFRLSNPEGYFAIDKNADGRYMLVSAGRPAEWAVHAENDRRIVLSGLQIYGFTMVEIAESGGYVCTDWSADSANGLSRLVLERKPNATTPIGNLAPLVKKDEVLSKFVVDVDPKHNYRIVRNESYVSNKSQQALFDVYEFAYLANQSHDFPESTSATVNGPKGREPGGQSKLVSFTPTAPPPEEFTLRFYGLGSPFPVKSIFFSRWLWLGIAALLTLFLYRAWSARHAAVN